MNSEHRIEKLKAKDTETQKTKTKKEEMSFFIKGIGRKCRLT